IKLTVVSALVLGFSGCANSTAATAYSSGDFRTAKSLWEKDCNDGGENGCYNLALMYQMGEGMAANEQKAQEIYKKACDLGSKRACFNSGVLYSRGSLNKIKVDKIKMLWKKACSMGHSKACQGLDKIKEKGY
ncbi:MAG: tetratricopeptide repeat protein, partial [Campylobacterota bacterium]|nr:tetratricopeptide repeat protein [Campylobacterota bacterium]